MREGLLVYNPIAGGRRREASLRSVIGRARDRGLLLSEWPTIGPGSATEIVRRALPARPDLVVVAGGDGTVGEVAAGLPGTDIPMAILPIGTTNVVAREYGLGRNPEEAEAHLTSPVTRPLTAWTVAGRTCLIGAGIGFDARVMKNTVPLLKDLFGRVGASWTATREWLRYEFPPIEVEGIDQEGRLFRRTATFVVSANTRRYAGDVTLSPFADPQDDLLDLVLFGSSSTALLFRFYQRLSRGKAAHLDLPGVSRLAARSFAARSLAGYELDVQVDGDACGTTPLLVGPAAGRVNVVVPSEVQNAGREGAPWPGGFSSRATPRRSSARGT